MIGSPAVPNTLTKATAWEGPLSDLFRDLRQAVRSLARRPAFSGAAILTLALGIGSLTGFFSVIYDVVFRQLPYPEPRSLSYLHWKTTGGLAHVESLDVYRFWTQQKVHAFAGFSACEAQGTGTTLQAGDLSEPVRSLRVSPNFFHVLRVVPFLGRGFAEGDERPGAPPVVMLSYRIWHEGFGGDPKIVGRPVRLGSQSSTVAGVMPAHFRSFPEADAWVPFQTSAGGGESVRRLSMIGRLREGVTYEQAEKEANSIFSAYKHHFRASAEDRFGVVLKTYKSWIVGDVRRDLLILFGAGALVFFICCINLFNLCLTNEACRAGSTAVRIALGASWKDIFRNAVAEYAVLASAALVIGSGLAAWALPKLMDLSPQGLPRADEVGVGPEEWLFALAAGSLAVFFVGLIPLLRLLQLRRNGWYKVLVDCRSVVKASTRKLGRTFVTGEVALSLAVLVSAFTMIEAFSQLRATSPGFETKDVMTFQVPLRMEGKEAATGAWRFSQDLEQRLSARPEVVAVATASSLPLETGLNVPLHLKDGDPDVLAEYRAVSPDYFKALGIPLKKGSGFEGADSSAAQVVIVNEALAKQYGKGRTILGETVWIAKDLGPLSDRPREVIGIVGDVRDVALGEQPRPTVYVPQAQVPAGLAEVMSQSFPLAGILKVKGSGLSQSDLRSLIRQVDPRQPVIRFRPLGEVLSASISRERFYTALLGVFAFLTLSLTGLGLYGVASGYVGQCSREIGLRMALGADGNRVLWLVMKDSLRLSLVGSIVGIPLGIALHRLVASLIPDFKTQEIDSLVAVGAMLALLAMLASLLPASRATRIDPGVVLRYE